MKTLVNGKELDLATPFVRDFALTLSAGINVDSNRDGKIELGEWLAFGQIAVMTIFRRYKDAGEAIRQIGNKNGAEFAELKMVFVEAFDVTNDIFEDYFERGISILADCYTLVRDITDSSQAA